MKITFSYKFRFYFSLILSIIIFLVLIIGINMLLYFYLKETIALNQDSFFIFSFMQITFFLIGFYGVKIVYTIFTNYFDN